MSLLARVAEALHADSDHGQDGDWPVDPDGGKRGVCNCYHKAKVALQALAYEMRRT